MGGVLYRGSVKLRSVIITEAKGVPSESHGERLFRSIIHGSVTLRKYCNWG